MVHCSGIVRNSQIGDGLIYLLTRIVHLIFICIRALSCPQISLKLLCVVINVWVKYYRTYKHAYIIVFPVLYQLHALRLLLCSATRRLLTYYHLNKKMFRMCSKQVNRKVLCQS